MLYIDFGHPLEFDNRYDLYILDVDLYFNNTYDTEWFEDPLVKEMILDVDKSVVNSPYCNTSPVMGQIPPVTLSGSVKALILVLKDDKATIWATACGDNCAKWIFEIAKRKDLTICLSHIMWLDLDSTDVEVKVVNTGKVIKTNIDYMLAASDFVH